MIASEPKQYGSEACHAYDRQGNPRHQVPYKDKKRVGEFRNTTIKDIRENGWLPSVSSILGVAAKKGLDSWMKEQVAKAAWENFDKVGSFTQFQEEEAISFILQTAEEKMTRARDLGTEIHGAIERYLTAIQVRGGIAWESGDCLESYAHSRCVEAAVDALKELGVWGQPFECEKTFASEFGYGGTIDFKVNPDAHGGMILKPGLTADFKCVDSLEKKLNYPDRCAQLCAYAMGCPAIPVGAIPNPEYFLSDRLVNIYISTSEPGKHLIHEWSTEDKEQGWKLFCASFELWKVQSRYYPVQQPPPHSGESR